MSSALSLTIIAKVPIGAMLMTLSPVTHTYADSIWHSRL
jgi:hypothetical protein